MTQHMQEYPVSTLQSPDSIQASNSQVYDLSIYTHMLTSELRPPASDLRSPYVPRLGYLFLTKILLWESLKLFRGKTLQWPNFLWPRFSPLAYNWYPLKKFHYETYFRPTRLKSTPCSVYAHVQIKGKLSPRHRMPSNAVGINAAFLPKRYCEEMFLILTVANITMHLSIHFRKCQLF